MPKLLWICPLFTKAVVPAWLGKDGKTSGLSPFDLLRVVVHGSKAEAVTARLMFAEYGAASQGKRQLVFSTGLRKMYDLDEIKDEDASNSEIAANGIEPDSIRLAMIPDKAWRFLLSKELRGPLVEATSKTKGDWAATILMVLPDDGLGRHFAVRWELFEAGELS